MSEDADEDAAERARKLFAGPIEFLKSAPGLQFLPDPDTPEIAFAGRSNVGKSSLLNALTNRKGLARTSNTPGRSSTAIRFTDRIMVVTRADSDLAFACTGRCCGVTLWAIQDNPNCKHVSVWPNSFAMQCSVGASRGTSRSLPGNPETHREN